jgi:hypothetical protein
MMGRENRGRVKEAKGRKGRECNRREGGRKGHGRRERREDRRKGRSRRWLRKRLRPQGRRQMPPVVVIRNNKTTFGTELIRWQVQLSGITC